MNVVIYSIAITIYYLIKKLKKLLNKMEKKRKKEFKPKPWLKKPDEDKVVMVYGYVKSKHKNIAQDQLKQMINQLKNQ
jgi:hypothetical protein